MLEVDCWQVKSREKAEIMGLGKCQLNVFAAVCGPVSQKDQVIVLKDGTS